VPSTLSKSVTFPVVGFRVSGSGFIVTVAEVFQAAFIRPDARHTVQGHLFHGRSLVRISGRSGSFPDTKSVCSPTG